MATYDLTSSIPSSSSLKTGDILNCPYSGTYKSINLPKGTYKLECWGSRGGGQQDGNSNTGLGGMGGYSYGILTLQTATTLYCYSGGIGVIGYSTLSKGGFNGGGSAWGSGNTELGCGGGGASDIRIGSNSLYARVIVAGGGGGGGEDSGDTGGYGGGTSGGSAGAAGGSQTSGGDFGQGRHAYDGGGGGGGWYGGLTRSNLTSPPTSGPGSDNDGGGGGSGYIYTSSTASNYPSGCLLNSSHYLTDAQTIAGNTSFTSPTGTTETGHSDNGYVRITIQAISNWAYSTVSIPAPTYNKQNTPSWTLSPSTCRYFSFTPTISGDFIVYSNSSIDTYGYLTSNITSLNSSGQPSSNILVSDDDYAKKYGGTGANFGICYKVTAGTTYYIYVKPYRDSTANSSVYLTYYMAHPDSRVYVKIDSTTWKLITN